MGQHNHGVASNTTDCFRTFIGCTVKGLLKDALPVGFNDDSTHTLIFEGGEGLTFSAKGTFWTESVDEVQRAIRLSRTRLEASKKELEGILSLAGEQLEAKP